MQRWALQRGYIPSSPLWGIADNLSGTSEADLREISNKQTPRSCSEIERRKGSGKVCCGFQLIVESNLIAIDYLVVERNGTELEAIKALWMNETLA